MEQKLAEFRARRRSDVAAKSEYFQKRPITSSDSGSTLKSASSQSSTADPNTQELTNNLISAAHQATRTKHWGDDWLLESTLGQWNTYVYKDDCLLECILGRRLGSKRLGFANRTLLKVLIWLFLLGLFAELAFGLPFFLISLFYWLYQGLRSPAKCQHGELSA